MAQSLTRHRFSDSGGKPNSLDGRQLRQLQTCQGGEVAVKAFPISRALTPTSFPGSIWLSGSSVTSLSDRLRRGPFRDLEELNIAIGSLPTREGAEAV